ncbi:MAG: hypothetical protein AAFU79_22100, partial [Myxococcota bacterium]
MVAETEKGPGESGVGDRSETLDGPGRNAEQLRQLSGREGVLDGAGGLDCELAAGSKVGQAVGGQAECGGDGVEELVGGDHFDVPLARRG